jgi:hypothetical protein
MRRLQFVVVALLLASAAHAAEAAGCGVRKGLYDAWLSVAKHTTNRTPIVGSLVSRNQPAPDPASLPGIDNEFWTYFQCLSDTPLPDDDDGGRSLCKDAGVDRLAAVVCQTALYLKSGRKGSKEFLDALPSSKKAAEMMWDLQSVGSPGAARDQQPAIFQPDGPAYKIVDELFVLVLDDRDTAATKYFHIVSAAMGAGATHVDGQIKILLREAPAVVVKQWVVLRQHQPRLKKLLSELSAELGPADMKTLRQGIANFCSTDNLDCPEILKTFGRP